MGCGTAACVGSCVHDGPTSDDALVRTSKAGRGSPQAPSATSTQAPSTRFARETGTALRTHGWCLRAAWTGGVPAGLGPSMTLSWRTEQWFGSLRFIGPVSSSLETTSGNVDIDQEQALVRVGVDLGEHAGRFVPFAAVGLGAYRLGARGDAVAPYRSTSNQAWSGMLQLTGGLRLRLSELIFVACEGGVWLASTKPVVRIEEPRAPPSAVPDTSVRWGLDCRGERSFREPSPLSWHTHRV